MGGILKDLQSPKYKPVFDSVKSFSKQFESSFLSQVKFPPSYKTIKNVVLCGMGGSALSADVIKALDILKVPFSFYNGYFPPHYVNKNTLFIASSYSGNTEEVLASLEHAKKRKAKIVAISAGGKLKTKAKNYPQIVFNSNHNPSGEPRYGAGFSLGALFNIFIKLGLTDYTHNFVKNLVFNLRLPSVKKAEELAKDLKGYAPLVVASEFLEGNAHIFTNQLNETCKVFSEFHSIPELNHHLMEGLKRPEENNKFLKFFFIESNLYSKKNQKRYEITKKVVRKNKIRYTDYKVKGKTRLEQVLKFLMLGSLTSVLLAVKYKEDPADIPWVRYFKKQL